MCILMRCEQQREFIIYGMYDAGTHHDDRNAKDVVVVVVCKSPSGLLFALALRYNFCVRYEKREKAGDEERDRERYEIKRFSISIHHLNFQVENE